MWQAHFQCFNLQKKTICSVFWILIRYFYIIECSELQRVWTGASTAALESITLIWHARLLHDQSVPQSLTLTDRRRCCKRESSSVELDDARCMSGEHLFALTRPSVHGFPRWLDGLCVHWPRAGWRTTWPPHKLEVINVHGSAFRTH